MPYRGGSPGGGSNDPMALGAMVVGIVGLLLACLCWPIGLVCSVVALVLGVLALRRLGGAGGNNRGFAITGIVTGGIGVVLALLGLVLLGVSLTSAGIS